MTDKELMERVRVRIMSEAYDLADRNDSEGYNSVKVMCSDVLAMIKASEQETGNLLKDAYNAMVEKKTRSQKLREAGFTRRPKGWEKEKDEQEPVAWMYVNEDGECEEIGYGKTYLAGFEGCTPLYTTPPQRPWVGLTDEDKSLFSSWLDHKTDDEVFAAIEAKLRSKNT